MQKQQLRELKKRLIKKAVLTHGRIYPCGVCEGFDDCFTLQGNSICFWFITEDKNSHMLKMSTSRAMWSNIAEQVC